MIDSFYRKIKDYDTREQLDSFTESSTELPMYVPESLCSFMAGGIPKEHLHTVFSTVKPRSTVSILNGVNSGLEPSFNPAYQRINLES